MGVPAALPPRHSWLPLVELAIREDLGTGDATTPLVVEAGRQGCAIVEAREPLVACGLDVAFAVFRAIDPGIECAARARDAARAEPGDVLASVRGELRSILAAERVALNFMMRMCGVATYTRRFVDAVAGTRAQIVDTRKTIPGWRSLDKYATRIGGAANHRIGLYDGILLKDNHVAIAGGVGLAVKTALASAPAHLRVCVEVESEEQALAAVAAGADQLLLDNCALREIRAIAARLGERAQLEVSGGVHLGNVREIAETGVHRISIGALTHSAPAADVALEIVEPSSGPRRAAA